MCWNPGPFSKQFVTLAKYSCWCQIHLQLDHVWSRNIFLYHVSLHTWARPNYSPSQREEIIKWKHIALIRASCKERERRIVKGIYMQSCRASGRWITFPLPLFPNISFVWGSSWKCPISCYTVSVSLMACFWLFSAELLQRKERTIIIMLEQLKLHELRWFRFIPSPVYSWRQSWMLVYTGWTSQIRSASALLRSTHAIKKHRYL